MAEGSELYHGSKAKFSEFSLDYLGANGTAQGFGVYLTPSKEVAEMYAGDEGYLYSVSTDLERSLSLTERTITEDELSELIDKLHESEEILSNLQDVDYYGYDVVKNLFLEMLESNENDVDLVNDIANIAGDQSSVVDALYEVGRYTHIFAEEQTRLKESVVIVLDPERIEIKAIEKQSLTNMKIRKNKDLERG